MLLCLAALALAPGIQDAADSEPRWPIGLTARRVEEVPAGDRLGDKSSPAWNPPRFEVEERAGVLVVRASSGNDYFGESVRLWLEPDGARAAASSSSCVHAWRDAILGGTACVITDGTRAAVDFEVFDGADAGYAKAYFGRIQLGAPGVVLAETVLARARTAEPLRLETQLHSRYERHDPGPRRTFASHGLVDGFGRRQGLWTVRELGADPLILEMSWRDGRPDGAYRRTWGQNTWIGTFRRGFEDGEEVLWGEDGERRVTRFSMGLFDGETVYDEQGRRLREWARSAGDERFREWSPEGQLLRDECRPDDLADERRGHAAHLAWLEELHTRRDE